MSQHIEPGGASDVGVKRMLCCRYNRWNRRALGWCALDYLLGCKVDWFCDRHERAICESERHL